MYSLCNALRMVVISVSTKLGKKNNKEKNPVRFVNEKQNKKQLHVRNSKHITVLSVISNASTGSHLKCLLKTWTLSGWFLIVLILNFVLFRLDLFRFLNLVSISFRILHVHLRLSE